ncbi:MAG: AsmA-like C-terminal region-containing protein, partial [Smithella sp.]|nr:AsmA-like C-terminal region-containing protein [Smithella sp.]
PEVSLNLDTSYLNSDDLLRLISLRQPKKEKPSSLVLGATVTAQAGKLTDIDFTDLRAVLKYSQEILDFETLEANCFDGKFKAKGKVKLQSGGKNQYDADISIGRMSLDHLQNYMDISDSTITGRLTLSGNVTATGGTFEELQKTAKGKIQIRAEKGVLKKYSVLSKIFSLLNVLQLARLKLPDVTTEGMAYNAMTADIAIQEGVLSSDNFFINSDSLQFSSTGKVNMINRKLDLIVGVHPLQSLDFIASKIPVAGWLITDERGKLVTLHFKVGGVWDNPDVSPMPAKSIGRGTLDIFKKIFQLPEKLITDTGDVLLGR